MPIQFPHTIKASTPVDVNNREISVGQEVVVLRLEELVPAKVLEVNLKTKKEKTYVKKYHGETQINIFSNFNFTEEEKKFFEIFTPEELEKGFYVETKSEYYSIKLQPTKWGSAFSTPQLRRIAVVAV